MPLPPVLRNELRTGDLVLTGRKNWFSEITQKVTESRFGHASLVDGNRVVEATDRALTPCEGDEGVFTLELDEFIDRTKTYGDVCVLRPVQLDPSRFSLAAERLVANSPTYPSVGTILLGFGCVLAGFTSSLPAKTKQRVLEHQYRLLADGPGLMHCSEVVIRLYHAAGMAIELDRPKLAHLIAHSRASQPELLPLLDAPRIAEEGSWPKGYGAMATFAVRRLVETLMARADPLVARDHAGLVLPGDLHRSPSFSVIFDVTRRPAGWYPVVN